MRIQDEASFHAKEGDLTGKNSARMLRYFKQASQPLASGLAWESRSETLEVPLGGESWIWVHKTELPMNSKNSIRTPLEVYSDAVCYISCSLLRLLLLSQARAKLLRSPGFQGSPEFSELRTPGVCILRDGSHLLMPAHSSLTLFQDTPINKICRRVPKAAHEQDRITK